jgi:hypothetical protein
LITSALSAVAGGVTVERRVAGREHVKVGIDRHWREIVDLEEQTDASDELMASGGELVLAVGLRLQQTGDTTARPHDHPAFGPTVVGSEGLSSTSSNPSTSTKKWMAGS